MTGLAGQRILVTRAAEDCAEWADELERRGARAVALPCIAAEPIDTPRLRAELAAHAAEADWLVFTSRRGIEAFAALVPGPLARGARVAAVGEATGAVARERLGRIDHVGAGTAAALADSLAARGPLTVGARCVLALAANASSELERRLAAAGGQCMRFDVYRTVPARARGVKQRLSALGADKILFASPSAVEGFLNQVEPDAPAGIFTIGPATSKAARARGLSVTGEARAPSFASLLEAMHG